MLSLQSQLLDKYGYGFESHSVQTEDGYILGVHRIPNPDKPAVLLVHGLLSSSTDYVNGGPNMSLAMQLADEGYDVWLGNCRGNTHSRNHISLDPNTNSSFWKFRFLIKTKNIEESLKIAILPKNSF